MWLFLPGLALCLGLAAAELLAGRGDDAALGFPRGHHWRHPAPASLVRARVAPETGGAVQRGAQDGGNQGEEQYHRDIVRVVRGGPEVHPQGAGDLRRTVPRF